MSNKVIKKNERGAGRKKILTPLEVQSLINDCKTDRKEVVAVRYNVSLNTVYRYLKESKGDENNDI